MQPKSVTHSNITTTPPPPPWLVTHWEFLAINPAQRFGVRRRASVVEYLVFDPGPDFQTRKTDPELSGVDTNPPNLLDHNQPTTFVTYYRLPPSFFNNQQTLDDRRHNLRTNPPTYLLHWLHSSPVMKHPRVPPKTHLHSRHPPKPKVTNPFSANPH